MRFTKNMVASGVVAAMLVVPLPEPADAHFRGKMRVDGVSGTFSRSVADGEGTNPELACSVVGGATAPAIGGSIGVHVVPVGPEATNCVPNTKLAPGIYKIYIYNGKVYNITSTGEYQARRISYNGTSSELEPLNCLDDRVERNPDQDPSPTLRWIEFGSITIDHEGKGDITSISLPSGLSANGVSAASAVCISNGLPFIVDREGVPPTDQGNQAPLKLT